MFRWPCAIAVGGCQGQLLQHAVLAEILFALRMHRSSFITARIVDADPGLTEVGVSDAHLVIVHLGAPVRARCRIDHMNQGSRVQVRGDIDIVPVGSFGSWHDETSARLLALRFSLNFADLPVCQIPQSHVVPRLQVRDESLTALLSAFEHELQSGQQDDLFLDGLGLALGRRVFSRFGERSVSRKPSGLRGCHLSRVQEYIEANLENCIRLPDLAGLTGLCTSQFTTAFRASVGMSPHQYVIKRRVDRARGMIVATSVPLSEIALACGFANQSHMNRRMNELLGITPGQLRRIL